MIELRTYQSEIAAQGADTLREWGLLYLNMEVRTGKTLTGLHTADLFGADSVLFLTKKKAIKSIEEDYKLLQPGFSLYAINYEHIGSLHPENYDLVIIDEAQNFGAFPKPSARMKAARKLCKDKPIIFLSGTPSPESYSQLFHQLSISSMGPYEHYWHDKKWGETYAFYRWARAGYVQVKKKQVRNGMSIDDYSAADGNMIWKDIKKYFIMFTQEQAGFEAPVEEYFRYVDMEPSTYQAMREIENHHILTRYIDNPHLPHPQRIATVNSGADLINKLAQLSSGTLIFDENHRGIVLDESKAMYIRQEFRGKKIAIFYRYKAELELLKHFFPAWTDSPEEFNARPDLTFLGQVQSAREGVNLSTADALVMYNIDFSATSYFQARARIQSKDRKGAAPLYWIFARNGIEDKIYRAVSMKRNFTYSYYNRNRKKELV